MFVNNIEINVCKRLMSINKPRLNRQKKLIMTSNKNNLHIIIKEKQIAHQNRWKTYLCCVSLAWLERIAACGVKPQR